MTLFIERSSKRNVLQSNYAALTIYCECVVALLRFCWACVITIFKHLTSLVFYFFINKIVKKYFLNKFKLKSCSRSNFCFDFLKSNSKFRHLMKPRLLQHHSPSFWYQRIMLKDWYYCTTYSVQSQTRSQMNSASYLSGETKIPRKWISKSSGAPKKRKTHVKFSL